MEAEPWNPIELANKSFEFAAEPLSHTQVRCRTPLRSELYPDSPSIVQFFMQQDDSDIVQGGKMTEDCIFVQCPLDVTLYEQKQLQRTQELLK